MFSILKKTFFAGIICFCVVLCDAKQQNLKAIATDMYYLNPEVETSLSWHVAKSTLAEVKYLIRDFHCTKVLTGIVPVDNGKFTVKLKLSRGYYEIVFPQLGSQAGIVVLEKYSQKIDEFYGADAAWSWLEAKSANRTAWMRLLKRYGIGIARERFTWGELGAKPNGKFDYIRHEYATNGLKVLDVHHDSPKILNQGQGGMMVIPTELKKVFKSWQSITQRFDSVWCAAETWNEENDEIFCGDTTPDRYTVYHKTLANAISRTDSKINILNGGFTEGVIPEYLTAMGENALLDFVDAVAIHVYKAPQKLQHSIKRYRAWMTKYRHPGLPIWITEAGNGYPKTSEKRADDKDSIKRAAKFNALGVEARAAGVAKFFPFVFAWYNLEATNYSLVDSCRTPTRSLAGYFFQIKQLGGSKYAGSIKLGNSVLTNRVFRHKNQATVVIFTEKPSIIDFPVIKGVQAYGVDGRKLLPPVNGKLKVQDGLIYVTADWKELADITIPAASFPPKQATRSKPFSPLILQFIPSPETTGSMRQGYKVEPGKDGRKKLTFKVWNFSQKTAKATITVPNAIPENQRVTISPESNAEVTARLALPELSPIVPEAFLAKLTDYNGKCIDRISLLFSARGRIKKLLKAFPDHVAVPLEVKRIKNPIAKGGISKLSINCKSVTANIDLRACSEAWNNWAGIYVKLSGFDFSEKTGVIFREVCTGSGWSDITWELRNNDRFRTIGFPVNSAAHDIYMPFFNKRMVYFASYDATKANTKFIPADITAIEFVIHSRNLVNTLKISDLYLVGPKK